MVILDTFEKYSSYIMAEILLSQALKVEHEDSKTIPQADIKIKNLEIEKPMKKKRKRKKLKKPQKRKINAFPKEEVVACGQENVNPKKPSKEVSTTPLKDLG